MKQARNWIIGVGVLAYAAFAVRGVVTGEDIPAGLQTVLMTVLGAGLGIEPLTELGKKALGKGKGEQNDGE